VKNPLAFLVAICIVIVSLPLAVCCWGASAVPAPRLARALPAPAVAAHDLRARHNAALKALFENTGIPLGDTLSNIAVRAASIELINYAITNGIELDGVGVSADAVAASAGDFVGRYILGVTNSATTNGMMKARSRKISK
jgi:hypothetical protein